MVEEKSSRKLEIYQQLFEASEDPMWLIVDGKFEVSNRAAVKTLGYNSRSELESTHPSELSPEFQPDGQSSFDKANDMMGKAIDNGYNRFEWVHCKKNGEDFPVEVTLTKIDYKDDIAIYCVWRDISKRKQSELAVEQALEKLELANQAKTNFLAHMSHELRTPLNAIIGFSEILSGIDPKSEKHLFKRFNEYGQLIHESGQHLLGIINDVLDLSKVEAGKIELYEEDFPIDLLIEESMNLLIAMAEKKKITLEHVSKGSGIHVFCDKKISLQVLLNIVSNAIKYTPEGGLIRIETLINKEGQLTLNVIDNGLGMTRDEIKLVMQPFEQVGGNSSLAVQGTGLGLPLVDNFMKLHSGSISIKSEKGTGTTVTLTFPSERTISPKA